MRSLKNILILIMFIGIALQVQAQKKFVTETFKVYGNCGMCKKTIETAGINQKGVRKCIWNQEKGEVEVEYRMDKISLDEIKKKIAAAGYDTDEFRAPDKAYNGLHGCCKYERSVVEK